MECFDMHLPADLKNGKADYPYLPEPAPDDVLPIASLRIAKEYMDKLGVWQPAVYGLYHEDIVKASYTYRFIRVDDTGKR